MQATVTGVASLVQKLRAFERKVGAGVEKGLKNAGKFLLVESNELVPVDDEDLKKSGAVRSTGRGLETVVRVSYSEPYAADVHEDLEVAHGAEYNSKHADDIANGRKYFYKGRFKTYHARRPKEQAKFLETALRLRLDEITGIVRHGVFSNIRS